MQRSVCSHDLLTDMTFGLSIPQMAVISKASDSPFNLRAVLAARRPFQDRLTAMLSLVHVALCSGCRFPVFQKQVGRLAAQCPFLPGFPGVDFLSPSLLSVRTSFQSILFKTIHWLSQGSSGTNLLALVLC